MGRGGLSWAGSHFQGCDVRRLQQQIHRTAAIRWNDAGGSTLPMDAIKGAWMEMRGLDDEAAAERPHDARVEDARTGGGTAGKRHLDCRFRVWRTRLRVVEAYEVANPRAEMLGDFSHADDGYRSDDRYDSQVGRRCRQLEKLDLVNSCHHVRPGALQRLPCVVAIAATVRLCHLSEQGSLRPVWEKAPSTASLIRIRRRGVPGHSGVRRRTGRAPPPPRGRTGRPVPPRMPLFAMRTAHGALEAR
jgi:hypothetical protein